MKNGHCTWLCAFGVPIQVVCAGEGGGNCHIWAVYDIWGMGRCLGYGFQTLFKQFTLG